MPGQFFNFSKYFKKDNLSHTDQTVSYDNSATVAPDSGLQAGTDIANPSQPVNPPGATGVNQPSSPADGQSAINMGKRVGMDVLSRLTQRAHSALMAAVGKAKELKIQFIDTEHVLWALLADRNIYQLVSECKAAPVQIQEELEKTFKPGGFAGQPQFSPRVKRALEISLSLARSLGYEFISPEHILLALSHEGEGMAAQTLSKYGLKQEVLNQKITGKKELEKEEEKKKTSALEQFTEDWTAKASRGELDPVVGRSWEIERVIHILSRRTKNNPVLIGEAGVGKTAIVEGLAQRVAKSDVPETLLHKKILSLDLMSVVAGAKHRGEFEERLKNLIKEVKAASGSVILFIDEIHNMVGAGASGEGALDASNILKPSLARGEIQVVGATTIAEYRKYVEKDAALERRFQPVLVPEPTVEVAIEMLTAIRDKYEAFHRVKISDEALSAAVKLSQRYIGDRFLPDKAVDLIDEAAASVRLPAISLPEEIKTSEERLKKLESEKQEAIRLGDKIHSGTLERESDDLKGKLAELKEQYQVKKSTSTTVVTPEIIADIVSRWTKIPISKLTESESTKLIDLEKIIHKRLIDQEDAVLAVAEAVRRGRAGLKSNKRPIGSFIFMGPTGVGKTELAKAIAEILFGSEDMMVRLDMTEYMEKHEVAKLIGAPPGYVGYEEGGQLTEAVRRRPYSVVLFDEVEKAHPDVFNILIQLLDDGRLTDNKGHTISFKNAIVICTSNLGSGIIQDFLLKEQVATTLSAPSDLNNRLDANQMLSSDTVSSPASQGEGNENGEGMDFAKLAGKLMEELRKFFRAELINRFDEIVIFRPLTREHMGAIVNLQIKLLSKLLLEQNIAISVTDKAKDFLATVGFDPVFGARPLRRTIQRLVENAISSLLIKKELTAGDTITIDCTGKELSFKVEKMKTASAGQPEQEMKKPLNLVPPLDKTQPNQSMSNNQSPVPPNQAPEPPQPPPPPGLESYFNTPEPKKTESSPSSSTV